MKKLLAILATAILTVNISLGYTTKETKADSSTEIDEMTAIIVWDSCNDDIRKTLPSEYLAYACAIEPWEFEYMAQVIYAESNRSTDWSDFEDQVLIACVILNRVESTSFRNTISGVLDEPGQFSTTSNGYCSCSSTQSSRWSIVIAQRRLQSGEIPRNVLYFNCIGFVAEPYCYEGGNYFSLG